MTTTPQTKQNSITVNTLKQKIDNEKDLVIFDVRSKKSFEKSHIPNAVYAICDANSQQNIMPKLPKNLEYILVGDGESGDKNDTYVSHMASMMKEIGFNISFLENGMNSWSENTVSGISQDIDSQNLKKMIDENEKFVLVDVREPQEYEEWNIDNSINIPLSQISEKISEISQNKKIITVCTSGNRSTIAKYILSSHGLESSTLTGGMDSWSTSFEKGEINVETKDGHINIIQVRRIGKGCMSHIVSSENESIVIDPVYPIEEYIKIAQDKKTKIIAVFDTHQHADHISAAKKLADTTNATLHLSGYESYNIQSSKIFHEDSQKFGTTSLNVIHTPGHTLGSLSFLVAEKFLFSGDTIFVDSVGRPDLRDNGKEYAEILHHTIHKKIMTLNDDVMILPTHFEKQSPSGSMITVSVSKAKKIISILKKSNDEFVETIGNISIPTPPNYQKIIEYNKTSIDKPQEELMALESGPNRCAVTM
jgi:rhodanese-related sulfurtransferase/glyoxylase-like metal-dependent hydrolase (beta-lactamase superfamily II)